MSVISVDSLEIVRYGFQGVRECFHISPAGYRPACALGSAPAPLSAHVSESVVEQPAEIKYDPRTNDIVHVRLNVRIGVFELEGGIEDRRRGKTVCLACPAFKYRCIAVFILRECVHRIEGYGVSD